MNITHFLLGRPSPDTANGVEKAVFYLAQAQAALGHRVTVLSGSAKPVIPIPLVNVVNFPLHWLRGWLPHGLKAFLRKNRPDLVHFHSSYVPEMARLAAWLRGEGIPYVATPQGGCSRHLLRRRAWLKIPYRRLVELPYLNRALFVQALGTSEEEEIRRYGVRAPLVDVPNGIAPETIPPWSGENFFHRLRPEWKGKVIYVYVGRLDPVQKGLDLLLDGLARALKAGVPLGLALVGPDWGGLRGGLEARVAQAGIASSVLFTGALYGSEKFEAIHSGDFFVHTSRWEGMPFSVLEALACGVPPFITPAADPGGWVARAGCGVLVEPDAGAIAEGLIRCASLPQEERKAMGAAGREIARTRLGWSGIARALVGAYAGN